MSTDGEIREFRLVGGVALDDETRDHPVPVVRFAGKAFLDGTEDLEVLKVDMGDGTVRVIGSFVLTLSGDEWDRQVANIQTTRGVLGALATHLDSTGLRPALDRHVARQDS